MLKISTILIALFLPGLVWGAVPGDDKTPVRDTSSAVVVYNAHAEFLPDASYSVADYTRMIDSLVHLDTIPVALVNQLNLYRSLSIRKPGELGLVIDSIFESPKVPKSVLSAVNIYMAAMEQSFAAPMGFAAYVPADNSPWPANSIYEKWNTEVPFTTGETTFNFDSTYTLQLVDHNLNCDFQIPFDGVVTSYFGARYGRNHNGIDIDLEVWDPVHAAFPGVVRVAKVYKGFGRVVVVRHYNGLETLYAHLHRFKVKAGDIVEAGDVVGLGGSSGNSTGSHLHFEVRFMGMPLKPSQIIDFKNDRLKNETITFRKSGAFLSVVTPGIRLHEVREGEYLYKIAQAHGTSVEKICELNQISKNQMLTVGQKLKVSS